MPDQTLLRYLQRLNWVLLALGATLAVNLAVVCLLYWLHLDDAPRYRSEFGSVMMTTGVFAGLTLAAAAAVLGQRKRYPWRWVAEAVLAFTVAGVVGYFLPD